MEKVTVKRKNYKTIEDGIQEIEVYRTIDGKEFDYEQYALRHEQEYLREQNENKIKKLRFLDNDLPSNVYRWYYAETQEDLETLKYYMHIDAKHTIVECEFTTNDWYALWTDYGGDSFPDVTHIVSWSNIKKELENYINSFAQ